MHNSQLKFYAQRTPFRGHVTLTVTSEGANGRLDLMQEPTFTEHPEYTVTRPAMTLTNRASCLAPRVACQSVRHAGRRLDVSRLNLPTP